MTNNSNSIWSNLKDAQQQLDTTGYIPTLAPLKPALTPVNRLNPNGGGVSDLWLNYGLPGNSAESASLATRREREFNPNVKYFQRYTPPSKRDKTIRCLPTLEEVKFFDGYEATSEGEDDKLEFKDQKGRDTESSDENKESSTGDTENAGIKSADPYPCLYCSKGYTTEKVLTMHEKKVVKLEKKHQKTTDPAKKTSYQSTCGKPSSSRKKEVSTGFLPENTFLIWRSLSR